MAEIFPREIGVVIANNKLAKEVFEEGMGLRLKNVFETARLYKLNSRTDLNVWTDGRKHPLSQAYLQFFADKEIILHTAKVLQNWRGVILKRSKDIEGRSFLLLKINLPEGTDISLSDRDWADKGEHSN